MKRTEGYYNKECISLTFINKRKVVKMRRKYEKKNIRRNDYHEIYEKVKDGGKSFRIC